MQMEGAMHPGLTRRPKADTAMRMEVHSYLSMFQYVYIFSHAD